MLTIGRSEYAAILHCLRLFTQLNNETEQLCIIEQYKLIDVNEPVKDGQPALKWVKLSS